MRAITARGTFFQIQSLLRTLSFPAKRREFSLHTLSLPFSIDTAHHVILKSSESNGEILQSITQFINQVA